MHHAVYNRRGDDGVSEVIAEVFEVNVLCGVYGYAERMILHRIIT
jgi:hypothetical protein